MKNEHLLPVNVIDIVDKFNNTTNNNEKFNYQLRVEAIRDYCDQALKKQLSNQPIRKTSTRSIP